MTFMVVYDSAFKPEYRASTPGPGSGLSDGRLLKLKPEHDLSVSRRSRIQAVDEAEPAAQPAGIRRGARGRIPG